MRSCGWRRDAGIAVPGAQEAQGPFLVQVEELKNIPSSSSKAIEEATAKRELLAKDKDKEEAKLRQVLASLQEETKGIQKEKEVWTSLFSRKAAAKMEKYHLLTIPLLLVVLQRSLGGKSV